jgi:hypothetical protein
LEQNELAKWIVAQYEDWIHPNSSWLGYVCLGILVVIVLLTLTARVNTWNQNAAWKHYYSALDSPQADKELELVANSTSGIVGVHARLALAQRQLTEGCSQVFIDKAEAIVMLEKAIVAFKQVQKATSDPSILQNVGFGLGYAWETLAAARVGDDLSKAEEEYQRVVSQWGDQFVGERAKKRLAQLQQPTTKTFLELTAKKTVESSEDDFKMPFNFSEPLVPDQSNLGTSEPDTESEPKQDDSDSVSEVDAE